jgi:hypothetical protein
VGSCGGGDPAADAPTPPVAMVPTPPATLPPANPPNSVLLSTQASNRGTGYFMSNKVIELADSFIATWTEIQNGAAQIMLAVLDYNFNVISRIVLAPAENNHGGAAIALDAQGYLHVLYGPHGNRMRYRRSVAPNDFTNFTEECRFGTYLTYPSIFIGPGDTLFMIAREGTGDTGAFGSVELWEKPVGAAWRLVSRPLVNRQMGYAAFNPVLFIDPINRMHISLCIHEGTNDNIYGLVQTAAYISSDDFGRTWRANSRGVIATLPGNLDDTDVIFPGGMSVGTVVSNGTITVDHQGIPRMLILVEGATSYRTSLYMASLIGGRWILEDLALKFANLPAGYTISDAGIIVAVGSSQLRIVFGAQKLVAGDRSQFSGVAWGHSTNTVFTALFTPGDNFINVTPMPAQGDGVARWLVNIERPTRIGCAVAPRIALYTRGGPDGGYLGGGAEVWAARL